jgi:transposase
MQEVTTETEQQLDGMLRVAGVARKASYASGEVQKILGISERTFRRMVSAYEPDPLTGRLRTPACLDSYMLNRSRRVRYDELAAYLQRNQTWERTNADPNQLELFD